MEWLNYHHLLYFWLVAREGGLARASAELHVSPSTLSIQIRALESELGEKLFQKSGRRLALTERGRIVCKYADEIFGLGRELLDTLHDRPVEKPLRLTVGVADVVAKLVAHALLLPALQLAGPVSMVCREDKPERLLAELATYELDVVLTDAPASPHMKIKAFSHLLGESDILFFGRPEAAARYRRRFPASLAGAPLLLPTENSALRRTLDQWFAANEIRPRIVAEFEDSALLKVFGQKGLGLFPAPAAIAAEVRRQHRVVVVGRLPAVKERFYALTVERRIQHPAVVAICEQGRKLLARG